MILSLSIDMMTCCAPLFEFKHLGGAPGTKQLLEHVTVQLYPIVIIVM